MRTKKNANVTMMSTFLFHIIKRRYRVNIHLNDHILHYLDEVDTLDDVDTEDDVETELEVDTLGGEHVVKNAAKHYLLITISTK